MNRMNKPMIRKSVPLLIASEICSVQPMVSNTFTDMLRVCSGNQRDPRQGERIHDFIRGWMRYYGT